MSNKVKFLIFLIRTVTYSIIVYLVTLVQMDEFRKKYLKKVIAVRQKHILRIGLKETHLLHKILRSVFRTALTTAGDVKTEQVIVLLCHTKFPLKKSEIAINVLN